MRTISVPKQLYVATAALLLLAGCAGADANPAQAPEPGAEGVWELLHPTEVSPESKSIEIGVIRLACAGGETGEIAKPLVGYEQDRVVIRADVVPPADLEAANDCQGNNSVPVTVHFDEALGNRELIDGACIAGEARTTSFCEPEAARWTP